MIENTWRNTFRHISWIRLRHSCTLFQNDPNEILSVVLTLPLTILTLLSKHNCHWLSSLLIALYSELAQRATCVNLGGTNVAVVQQCSASSLKDSMQSRRSWQKHCCCGEARKKFVCISRILRLTRSFVCCLRSPHFHVRGAPAAVATAYFAVLASVCIALPATAFVQAMVTS